jgi:hypothetical protein
MVSPCKHTHTPAVSSVQQTALNSSGHSNPQAESQHPLQILGIDPQSQPQQRLSPPTSIKSGDDFKDTSAGVSCLSPLLSQVQQQHQQHQQRQHYHHPSPPGHSYPYESSMMLSEHSDAPIVSSTIASTDNGSILNSTTPVRSDSNLSYENDERWYQSRNTPTAPRNITSTENAVLPPPSQDNKKSPVSLAKQPWTSADESINTQQHPHHSSECTGPCCREQNNLSPPRSNTISVDPTNTGNTTMMVTHSNSSGGNSNNGSNHHSSMSRDAATARRSSFTASYERRSTSISSGEQMMTSDSHKHAYVSNPHVHNSHNTTTTNYPQRSPYTSGSVPPPPPSHESYASSPSMAGSQESGYYRDHHDRRYQNAYMQQNTYSLPPHHPSYSAARPPLEMSPNTRSNYLHYGYAHPHEAADAAPPSASHVTRPLGPELYNRSNPVPCKYCIEANKGYLREKKTKII